MQDTNNVDNNLIGNKKRLLFVIVFIVITIASVLAIISFNKSFSIRQFVLFFKSANPLWMGLAIFSMFLFILTEGLAIKCVCKSFRYKTNLRNSFAYSSADIYFSAITPSASGGQPATAYFMHKDGIPLSVITIAMFCILMMYSLAIVIINVICFLIKPDILFEFDFLAKIIIFIGVGIQFILIAFFYFLLFNETLLYKICHFVLDILAKLHLIKNKNSKIKKLNDIIEKYKESAIVLKEHRRVLLNVFFLIFMQRVAQIGVVACVFIATGGNLSNVFDIITIQSFVVSGSYCIPIPGAIGITDYLMLNGFKTLMEPSVAVNLELIGRGISFYCCIILCGLTVLLKYCLQKRSSRK